MNIKRLTVTNTCINLALSAVKVAAGIMFRSSVLLSDAADNASDAAMSIVAMFGLRAGLKPPDESHRYGHELIECVFSVILAVALFFIGAGIGQRAVTMVISGFKGELEAPDFAAAIVAAVSIAVKIFMWRWTLSGAVRYDSSTLRASALNYRGDVLSGIGVFVGIVGANLGLVWLDPVFGAVISLLIIKSAVEVFKDAADRMTDRSADDATEAKIRGIINATPGVLMLDDLKTRVFNSFIYVDIEIAADSGLTLVESHRIAEDLHDLLEREIPKIKHCTVHVNPSENA